MGSLIAGWTLFVIGVLIYVVSLWERIKRLLSPAGGEGEGRDLGDIADVAEAVARLAEAFAKFSEEIQFLLLGTGCLVIGLYLLVTRPF